MELQTEGKLLEKFETTTHGETFKKMEFIIEIDDKYPQLVKMEVHNDNISKIDQIPIGTIANWYFNLRGRKWTNKETKKVVYFNSLVVWRSEVIKTDIDVPLKTSEIADDLPF